MSTMIARRTKSVPPPHYTLLLSALLLKTVTFYVDFIIHLAINTFSSRLGAHFLTPGFNWVDRLWSKDTNFLLLFFFYTSKESYLNRLLQGLCLLCTLSNVCAYLSAIMYLIIYEHVVAWLLRSNAYNLLYN